MTPSCSVLIVVFSLFLFPSFLKRRRGHHQKKVQATARNSSLKCLFMQFSNPAFTGGAAICPQARGSATAATTVTRWSRETPALDPQSPNLKPRCNYSSSIQLEAYGCCGLNLGQLLFTKGKEPGLAATNRLTTARLVGGRLVTCHEDRASSGTVWGLRRVLGLL